MKVQEELRSLAGIAAVEAALEGPVARTGLVGKTGLVRVRTVQFG